MLPVFSWHSLGSVWLRHSGRSRITVCVNACVKVCCTPAPHTVHYTAVQRAAAPRRCASRGSPRWTTPSVMGPECSGLSRPSRILAVREREGPAGGSTLITWVGAAGGCRLLAQGNVDVNFAGQAPLDEGVGTLVETHPAFAPLAFAPHASLSRSGELHGRGSC